MIWRPAASSIRPGSCLSAALKKVSPGMKRTTNSGVEASWLQNV
jgi:hypothetical protein